MEFFQRKKSLGLIRSQEIHKKGFRVLDSGLGLSFAPGKVGLLTRSRDQTHRRQANLLRHTTPSKRRRVGYLHLSYGSLLKWRLVWRNCKLWLPCHHSAHLRAWWKLKESWGRLIATSTKLIIHSALIHYTCISSSSARERCIQLSVLVPADFPNLRQKWKSLQYSWENVRIKAPNLSIEASKHQSCKELWLAASNVCTYHQSTRDPQHLLTPHVSWSI